MIGFVKELVARDNAVAVAVALTKAGPREFWFHFGDIEIGPSTSRRRVKSIENLITGERHIARVGRRSLAHRSAAGPRPAVPLLRVKVVP